MVSISNTASIITLALPKSDNNNNNNNILLSIAQHGGRLVLKELHTNSNEIINSNN